MSSRLRLPFFCLLAIGLIGAGFSVPTYASRVTTLPLVPQWEQVICSSALPIDQAAYTARMSNHNSESAQERIPAAIERVRQQAPELFEIPDWPQALDDFYHYRAQAWLRYSPSFLQSARDRLLLPTPGLFQRIAFAQCHRSFFVHQTLREANQAMRSLDGPSRGSGSDEASKQEP